MLRNLKNTWKVISVLSLVSLTTFFVEPDVALAALGDKCDDFREFEENGVSYLEGNCDDKNGNGGYTTIAISEYIANYNANLSWATPPGNYHKSCRNIDVDEDGLLTADCRIKPEGPYLGSELDLNERISVNAEGDLIYTEVRDCISIPGPPSVPVCK